MKTDIRPPVTPVSVVTLRSGVSCDAGDPEIGGAFSNSAVNCWMAFTCSSRS